MESWDLFRVESDIVSVVFAPEEPTERCWGLEAQLLANKFAQNLEVLLRGDQLEVVNINNQKTA